MSDCEQLDGRRSLLSELLHSERIQQTHSYRDTEGIHRAHDQASRSIRGRSSGEQRQPRGEREFSRTTWYQERHQEDQGRENEEDGNPLSLNPDRSQAFPASPLTRQRTLGGERITLAAESQEPPERQRGDQPQCDNDDYEYLHLLQRSMEHEDDDGSFREYVRRRPHRCTRRIRCGDGTYGSAGYRNTGSPIAVPINQ